MASPRPERRSPADQESIPKLGIEAEGPDQQPKSVCTPLLKHWPPDLSTGQASAHCLFSVQLARNLIGPRSRAQLVCPQRTSQSGRYSACQLILTAPFTACPSGVAGPLPTRRVLARLSLVCEWAASRDMASSSKIQDIGVFSVTTTQTSLYLCLEFLRDL